MATDTSISNTAAKAAYDAITALLNAGGAGSIKIYAHDGTPAVPVDCDAGLGGATLLVTLTLSADGFGDAVDGTGKATATANAITNGTAVASDTAAFFRACNNSGTAVIQGTVGTVGCDMNLNSADITTGATVSITSWTFSVPEPT